VGTVSPRRLAGLRELLTPPLTFIAKSLADTERLGAALAAALPSSTTVALIGTLGAGKTRLVQAVAAALGVPREAATSPTFVLVNEYRGRLPVYHFDAYRLRDQEEFLDLGPEEYFESDGITFVEWADRVAECLPTDRIEIRCEAVGENSRRFVISATSPKLEKAVRALNDSLRGELTLPPVTDRGLNV
jgi:tRNA threonylcarbamoyladenosine biosynthesis protein TsaE